MALKTIMLRRSIDRKKSELEELRKKDEDFSKRESELETAINEAATEEEEKELDDEIEQFDSDKQAHETEKKRLSDEIEQLEGQLKDLEKADFQPETDTTKREVKNMISTRTKFFGMNAQERDMLLSDESVKKFLGNVRTSIREKRGLSGAEALIPLQILDLIRENITEYSKLYKHVRVRQVAGKSRQTVAGTIPEGVWTEAVGSLNKLRWSFSGVEVDGYKVGGYIPVANSLIEDSDIDLASEIIKAVGRAIGYAIDKAILYGTGIKMPTGIVTRLVQESDPSNANSNIPWVDLHTSNIISVTGKNDVALFQAIVAASGAAKGKYSSGAKFWAMNEKTHTKLMSNAVALNAAGAIVAGVGNTMPVIGGAIEELSFIPDDLIIGGYGDLYLLAERSGTALETSKEAKFLDDQTVFKGTARYDGQPVIAEGFIVINLGAGTVTAGAVTFAEDTANE